MKNTSRLAVSAVSILGSLSLNSCCSLCFSKAELKPTSSIKPGEGEKVDWDVGVGGTINWGTCQDEDVCRALKRMEQVVIDAEKKVKNGTLSPELYSKLYLRYVDMVAEAAKTASSTSGNIPKKEAAPGSAPVLSSEQKKEQLGNVAATRLQEFDAIAKPSGL